MWRYWLGTKFLLYFVALYEIHLILIAMNLPLTYYVDYDKETKILKLIMRVDYVNCLIWRRYIMGSIKQVFRCRMCELVNVEFIWRWIVMRLGCMRMGICVSILFFFYNPSSRLAKLKCTQNPDWNEEICVYNVLCTKRLLLLFQSRRHICEATTMDVAVTGHDCTPLYFSPVDNCLRLSFKKIGLTSHDDVNWRQGEA